MTLAQNESNPVYDIIRKFKLLLSNGGDMGLEEVMEAQRFLSFAESIFKSSSTSKVFIYALRMGAFTAWDLQVHLDIPEATVYRALKRLRRLGAVEKVTRITRQGRMDRGKGGPRPVVWAILGADEKQVVDAYHRHLRSVSPKYRVAEKWVQGFLEDYEEKDVEYKMILDKVYHCRFDYPYHPGDIANLAAVILKDRGLRVWR